MCVGTHEGVRTWRACACLNVRPYLHAYLRARVVCLCVFACVLRRMWLVVVRVPVTVNLDPQA